MFHGGAELMLSCMQLLCRPILTLVRTCLLRVCAHVSAERLIMQELEACKAAGLDAQWVSRHMPCHNVEVRCHEAQQFTV